ncbi:MAG: 2-isopropylmalate synthase [Candidatus Thiodiazotropha taylori]|nr:2-isopropylmalate synthase [Candidatus Thiodiazotropha taylori]MCG7937029.1 2-isopropylmalate synthase [Candidatus Thiodiazotropha taylori]
MRRFDHRKYRANPANPMPGRQWPDNTIEAAPIWSSVDLRDGNQALLEPMNVTQKRRLWNLLVSLGLKQIEVGFPSASQPDYDFVRMLIEDDLIPEDVTIQVLVQARESLIKKTFEALRGARRAIVHVYNSTSTIQRERVFKRDREGIKAIAVEGAEMVKREAANHPQTEWVFEYSPESFSNTEWDYAVEVCDAVIDVWQPTPSAPCIINLPATVESSTPNLFADQVEYFCRQVSRRESVVVSVHTHNDRGSAVAAAELALLAGADRVEGTLLGNGERTGNMDIVTMAMNLYSQGIDPMLDLSNPDEIIQVYRDATGLPVHPRHPWIGELVYTAFSGSHQDAIRKCLHEQQEQEPWQVAYLPIDPRDIGRDYQAVIRVNSQSGKGGVAYVLERDYGLVLPRWLQVELANIVQQESEQHQGEVSSETIHELFKQHFVSRQGPYQLAGYRIDRQSDSEEIQAELQTESGTATIKGEGKGAISAFIDALSQRAGVPIQVIDYVEHAIGEGADAEAAAYVLLNYMGQRTAGASISRDTVNASLNAVLSAINLAMTEQQAA